MNQSFLTKHLGQKKVPTVEESVVFDSAAFTEAELTLASAAAVEAWVDTDDLDDGETLADRLISYFVGIADEDADGELSEDDQAVIEQAMESAGDYMESLGVDASDIDSLLNDRDEDAAERVQDLLKSAFADMDSAEGDERIDGDTVAFDATYKKKRVVRGGKMTWVKKRVSGNVRLSAKQKLGLKKTRRKANSTAARHKRMKSMRLRKKSRI